MPEDAAVLTIEFKTNLLTPARVDYLLFRAHVLKPGRTVTVCEAQAFGVGVHLNFERAIGAGLAEAVVRLRGST